MCFALFAWFARAALLARIAKTAASKACNECKTVGQLGLVCAEMPEYKCSFPNRIFLILVVRNSKRSLGIDGKTSACLFRIFYFFTDFLVVRARA